MKKYKVGKTIFVVSQSDIFYYTLHQDDVDDIYSGEFKEAGLKISSKAIEILKCLFFAVMPLWCYDKLKPCNSSYRHHLVAHFKYAWQIFKIAD